MADSTSTPASGTNPPPAGHRAANSGTNKAHTAALDKAETIANAALDPAHLAQLIAEEGPVDPADDSVITEAGIQDLLAAVEACRKDLGRAGSADATGEDATGEIDVAEHDLVAAIQTVQARARQKHKRKSPAMLTAYHIGHRLMDNRSNLDQFATDILTQLETDKLPGIGAAQKKAITDAQKVWKDAIKKQAGAGGAGKGGRQSVRQQLEAIMTYRLRIQYAADAIWPYHDPANTAVRAQFNLTANRPFDG